VNSEKCLVGGALSNSLLTSFHAPFADHIDISSSDTSLREQALAEIFQAAEAAAVFHGAASWRSRWLVCAVWPRAMELASLFTPLFRRLQTSEAVGHTAEMSGYLGQPLEWRCRSVRQKKVRVSQRKAFDDRSE